MEIETTFETYVVIDDEEFKVEVLASGDIVEEGFSNEFGFTSQSYIDNVFITSIINLEDNTEILFKSLSKNQQRYILRLAEEELNEGEAEGIYDE